MTTKQSATTTIDGRKVNGAKFTADSNGEVTPTDLRHEVKRVTHQVETQKGHKVNISRTVDSDEELNGSFDDRVMEIVKGVVQDREKRENLRANKRNFNRMLTLMGALVIGLIVTFVLSHNGIPGVVSLPHWASGLAPYAFVITILMDSSLALYSYIKHY